MKQSPEVTLRIPEDVLKKALIVSEAEGRTLNNQVLLLLQKSIAYFERTKGRISPSALAAVDISGFTGSEK